MVDAYRFRVLEVEAADTRPARLPCPHLQRGDGYATGGRGTPRGVCRSLARARAMLSRTCSEPRAPASGMIGSGLVAVPGHVPHGRRVSARHCTGHGQLVRLPASGCIMTPRTMIRRGQTDRCEKFLSLFFDDGEGRREKKVADCSTIVPVKPLGIRRPHSALWIRAGVFSNLPKVQKVCWRERIRGPGDDGRPVSRDET